jgi:hypothetical protein
MAKKINVLKIEGRGAHSPNIYDVYITKRQVMALPAWVHGYHGATRFFEGANPKHRYTPIKAKDELEAMMRFQKLWVALKSIEEN